MRTARRHDPHAPHRRVIRFVIDASVTATAAGFRAVSSILTVRQCHSLDEVTSFCAVRRPRCCTIVHRTASMGGRHIRLALRIRAQPILLDMSGNVTGSYTGRRFFLSGPNFFIHKDLRETNPGASILNLGQSSDCKVNYARPCVPEYGNPGTCLARSVRPLRRRRSSGAFRMPTSATGGGR